MSSAESSERQLQQDSEASLVLDLTGTKNTGVVSVSCLWGFFLESNEVKELWKGWKTGEVGCSSKSRTI